VERLAAVGGCVGGNGPGAGDGIERGAERRKRAPETDEAQEEDRYRNQRGRAEVDEPQNPASLAQVASHAVLTLTPRRFATRADPHPASLRDDPLSHKWEREVTLSDGTFSPGV